MKVSDKVIGWWSGGITSSVACKLAIDIFGKENCRIIMIDTKNEHEDTYRFKKDCEKWYDLEIEIISAIPDKYESIQEVWRKHKSLNVAHGAICSSELKRMVRERWQKENTFEYQVFGFEFSGREMKRATGLALNHPKAKPIFPLIMMGYDKKKCLKIVQEENIEVPEMYKLGFSNNNCFQTGCIQGGVGYWKKIQSEFPEKFESMANMEHELTKKKGKPVTILKKDGELVFLKKNPDYPNFKTIEDCNGRTVETLLECNGFCGTNDMLEPSKIEEEINFQNKPKTLF